MAQASHAVGRPFRATEFYSMAGARSTRVSDATELGRLVALSVGDGRLFCIESTQRATMT
jgi:hypothetical protein